MAMIRETKLCRACGIVKPIAEFNRTPNKTPDSTKDLRARCKACHKVNYKQWRLKNKEIPFEPPLEKHCTLCQMTKPGTEFSRNRSAIDGLDYFCRACKHLKYIAQAKRTPEQARAHHLRQLYHIELSEYDEMLKRQNGKCPICNRVLQPGGRGLPPIDHNHQTGKIRGVVCHKCNIWLGTLERLGPDWVERISLYLNN